MTNLDPEMLDKLPADKKAEARAILEAISLHQSHNRIDSYFPDSGPLRRALYPKHVEWMTSAERERAFIAGNRCGKTDALIYVCLLHMSGIYPDWWTGKRYSRPVQIWFGDTTNEQARDVLQLKIMGIPGQFGTGLLRKSCIERAPTMKRGMSDAVDAFYVKHAGGGTSVGWFKSYEQGVKAWQGSAVDIVALNEEPPADVYSEARLRTMTLKGEVLAAFTPLNGMSDVVCEYLEGGKFYVSVSWDEVPHLSKEDRDLYLSGIPLHERDARTRGTPTVGSGKIYPIPEDSYVIEDHSIPAFWAKGYGLDVGWNKTAAIFGALDRESDILTIYSEHYAGQDIPPVHASAIKARGLMNGLIDPASLGGGQDDGKKLIQQYRDCGLQLIVADNAVEPGILTVWERFRTGRLRIFRSCVNLLSELRIYHRDRNGKPVKKRDHACDALRYLCRGTEHMGFSLGKGNMATLNGVRYLCSVPGRGLSNHERPLLKRVQ